MGFRRFSVVARTYFLSGHLCHDDSSRFQQSHALLTRFPHLGMCFRSHGAPIHCFRPLALLRSGQGDGYGM